MSFLSRAAFFFSTSLFLILSSAQASSICDSLFTGKTKWDRADDTAFDPKFDIYYLSHIDSSGEVIARFALKKETQLKGQILVKNPKGENFLTRREAEKIGIWFNPIYVGETILVHNNRVLSVTFDSVTRNFYVVAEDGIWEVPSHPGTRSQIALHHRFNPWKKPRRIISAIRYRDTTRQDVHRNPVTVREPDLMNMVGIESIRHQDWGTEITVVFFESPRDRTITYTVRTQPSSSARPQEETSETEEHDGAVPPLPFF